MLKRDKAEKHYSGCIVPVCFAIASAFSNNAFIYQLSNALA